MQTPKKFSSFSDQVSWISDEKGIKIKDREYAEEMLRQIGYFPLMGGYKHLFRISNTKKYKVGTSFEEIVSRESILLPEVFQKQYVPASRCSDTDSLQKSENESPGYHRILSDINRPGR